MPGNQIKGGGKPYLSVVAGNLVQKVEEGTPGAKLRKWELRNGTKGEKWELSYINWAGKILGITFEETNFGQVCKIEMDDAYISVGTDSRYFKDFASKLLSGDLTKPFVFHPYDMETENGKKTGVSLQQDGEKLKSFFYDGEKNTNGFPEVDEEMKIKLKKNYWKVYFAEIEEFLIKEIKKLKFVPREDLPLETTTNSTSDKKTPGAPLSASSVDSDEGFIGDHDLPF